MKIRGQKSSILSNSFLCVFSSVFSAARWIINGERAAMTETTDRPQVPPDVVLPGESLVPSPPLSAETYQPLSLLAMAGFGLAVAYTLLVVVGGVIALFTRTPWLMPYWTFMIPVAAVVVCWSARSRICASEGTLSGLGFRHLGRTLDRSSSLAPMPPITALTFFVVRHGGRRSRRTLVRAVQARQIEEAFLVSQGIPAKGMDRDQTRDMIEMRFNQGQAVPECLALPRAFARTCISA